MHEGWTNGGHRSCSCGSMSGYQGAEIASLIGEVWSNHSPSTEYISAENMADARLAQHCPQSVVPLLTSSFR